MEISGRKIGPEHPPLIIAEIGINHGGSLDVAKKMVQAAASVGCECVKHQTHFVEDEMTEEAKSIIPPNADLSIWDVIASSALSRSCEVELKNYTENLGMIYLSTPFSRSAADFLDDIGVPAFKIGSGECDNIPLIKHIAKKGKPIIMSTGMQTIDTIKQSVSILNEFDIDLALLECTNLYPSPPEHVSLKGITELRKAFPSQIIGFSDHSIGPDMAIASIALGASIVERHFTDSRYRAGPDIICSMDPVELAKLIRIAPEIYHASQNEKKRSKAEEAVHLFARSTVVADKNLPSGHTICEEDIWARRPGTGEIPGKDFSKIIGRKLLRSVKRNYQLKWEDLDS